MKQEQVRSNPNGGSYEDGTVTARSFQLGGWPSWSRARSNSAILQAGLVQLGGWPSWSRARSSSAIRRDGHVLDRARPSAELDWFSSAIRRAGRVVDPARPSTELVAWSIQLGHPPSWTVCSVHPSIKHA